MQNGLVQNYNLSLSKGTEDFKVTTGANYYNQEGILRGGGYERYNFKLNTEFQLTPKIRIGENITVARSTTTNGPNVVWDVQLIEPITTVYRPEYEQTGLNEFSIYSPTTTDVGNPVAQIARNFYTTDYLRVVGNVYFEWELISGFKFKSQYNIYVSNWEDDWFEPDYFIEQTDKRDVNSVSRAHNNRLNHIWENYLTYRLESSGHSLTALVGTSMESRLHKTLYGQGENTPNNSPSLRFLSATTGSWQSVTWNSTGIQPSDEESTLLSYFGRLNYSYSDRYILAASIRADGSSKFPEENKWGLFPAVSGAWVISEEGFMENLEWIDQLKIRAGWGQVGNQFFEDVNARYSRMGIYYTTMGANQDVVIGAAPSSIGNSLLQWETVEDINLGLDFTALSNKMVYSLDLFQRKSKDMILWTSVPGYMGFGYTQQLTNIGELDAKGYEMIFKYRDTAGDLRYEVGFNLSSAKTRIKKLVHGESIQDGNHQRLNMLTNTMEGETAGAFYGFETDGIFQNYTEINSHADEHGNLMQPQAEPGDFRFRDLNQDGILDDNDQRVIGNPEPDFTYGLNGLLTYRGIELHVLFTGSYGNDVLNAIRPYTATGEGYYNSEKGLLERAWDAENSTDRQPRIKSVDQNQNFRYSDFFIEDGSYIRLKNIQLGYNLPEKILKHLMISKAKIYFSAENIWTVTDFSGLDPDMGGWPTVRGIDWGHYPLPKRMNVGLKLTL
jgi:TonB-linked SusC/RagA family outer membrane protein